MCSTRTASLPSWHGRTPGAQAAISSHAAHRVARPRALRARLASHPGCYVTGDVATRDKDGYIAVLGRYDDVLNVAGHRIGTAEVESALVSHPAVAEAAAIGVPDPMKGETIKVFVQVRADHVASEALSAALIEHVRRELGPIANSIVVGICGCVAQDQIRKNSAPLSQGEGSRRRRGRCFHDGRLIVGRLISPPSPENFVDITPAREAVSAFRL